MTKTELATLSLADRIDAVLDRMDNPRQGQVVKLLLPTLSDAEKQQFIEEGLDEWVCNALRLREAKEPQLASVPTAEEVELDERFKERMAAAEKQRVWAQERNAIALKTYVEQARIQELKNQEALANKYRREGVLVGLAARSDESVWFDGEWMALGDCTPQQLDDLAERCLDHVALESATGAYYRALAREMRERGARTVRELCQEAVAA